MVSESVYVMESSQWEVELKSKAEADFHHLILGIISLGLDIVDSCIN
jgi:hypothetical protein